jgi:hypothetical protein
MALNYDPIATQQLKEMRGSAGPRYIDAIWALRTFEQATRNEEAAARWRRSFPAWARLFQCPVRTHAANADVIPVSGRVADSKAA